MNVIIRTIGTGTVHKQGKTSLTKLQNTINQT